MQLQTYLLPELTSRQCNEYQVQGGDIMLVPVGSVQTLGPHLPVGGRCFVAMAFCHLMAEKLNAPYLPVTPYTSVQTTFEHCGSLDLPETSVHDYMRAVLDDLLATGFRRILLVTYLDYLRYYIPQEFYEDHNVAAAGVHLGELLHQFGRERGVGEDSYIAGALAVLGRDDLVAKIERENERLLKGDETQSSLPDELASLRRVGTIGFSYPPGSYPLRPNRELSPEKGADVLRQAVEQIAPSIGNLRDYNEFLARRSVSRGLMWQGWRWFA